MNIKSHHPASGDPSEGRIPNGYIPVIRLLWPCIVHIARRYHLSAELLLALCWIESGLDAEHMTPDDGEGLLGMRPVLAYPLASELRMWHPDLTYTQVSLHLGAHHLARLMAEFPSMTLVLLAWHLGVETARQKSYALLANPLHADYLQRVLSTRSWLIRNQPWRGHTPSGLPWAKHALEAVFSTISLSPWEDKDSPDESPEPASPPLEPIIGEPSATERLLELLEGLCGLSALAYGGGHVSFDRNSRERETLWCHRLWVQKVMASLPDTDRRLLGQLLAQRDTAPSGAAARGDGTEAPHDHLHRLALHLLERLQSVGD